MGVVAGTRRSSLSVVVPTAAYALLVCFAASRHEPWADEAQAWLLARDSRFWALWTTLLHYEGTPGLWHSLLWVLTRLHVSYGALNYFSAAFGVAGAYLMFRFSPFVLPVRLLLPFTYFLAYQYAVVARSYVLIPPLLFGLAAVYNQRERRPLLYECLLGALALCSMHGLVLAWAIAVTTVRRVAPLFFMATAVALWCAWPAADVAFVRKFNYSSQHIWLTADRVLAEAFTADWRTALVLIGASVPFFARGRSLLFFLLTGVAFIGLAAVVYGQVWHFGLLFLAWLFAYWLAALRTRPGWLANTAMVAALAIHCFWTVSAVYREVHTAYSGGLETARYLAKHGIVEAGLYGMGYAPVAVQPYFGRNIFINFEHSYWDWSSQNHMIRDYEKLPESRPPWVLVGYKTAEENYLWNSLVHRSGYRRIEHFEGNVIWEDEQFEPESFDLYQRQ